MKIISVFFLFISNLATASEGLWNRFDCVYGRQGTSWRKDFAVYSTRNFALRPGQTTYSPQVWTTRPDAGGKYYAMCSVLIGNSAADSLRMEFFAWSAANISDVEDCQISGKGVQLLQSEQRDVARGETLTFRMPWSGEFEELILFTRIPSETEMRQVDDSADLFCDGMAPR